MTRKPSPAWGHRWWNREGEKERKRKLEQSRLRTEARLLTKGDKVGEGREMVEQMGSSEKREESLLFLGNPVRR